MKTKHAARALLITSALLLALTACQKPEGPAERAGKQIDKMSDQAGQQIEKAGQDIQDAARGNKK